MSYRLLLLLFLTEFATAQEQLGEWQAVRTEPNLISLYFSANRSSIAEVRADVVIEKSVTSKQEIVYRMRSCTTRRTWTKTTQQIERFGCTTSRVYGNQPLSVEETYLKGGTTYTTKEAYIVDVDLRPDGLTYNLDDYTIEKLRSRKELELIFLDMNGKKWSFYSGLNFMPSFSDNIAIVQNPTGNSEPYADRSAKARADWGFATNIQIGGAFRRKHVFFAEASYLRQGFRTDNMTINWQTSLPASSENTNVHYTFAWLGSGIGYIYSAYRQTVNLEFELALNHYWINDYSDNVKNGYSEDLNIRNKIIAGRIGLGFNWRPQYGFSMRFVPCIIYDFTAVNKQAIKTRLFNAGINVGIALHPYNH